MQGLRYVGSFVLWLLPLFGSTGIAQEVTGQDIDKILERADKLLEEAKAAYEEASSKSSVQTFIEAGFKLEEARIKYLVLQEIGSADKQRFAADRLRAVNQLSKLIHDGKVAIGGTPAEPALVNPSDPAPAKDPAVPPAKPPVDVSKRAPVPDMVKQREAEKLVKDLFKEQYAKKTPAERKALARLLLDQVAKSQEDPVAVWVLCREAQDIAVQNSDVGTALEAIETAARVFDVDAMSMKTTALMAAAKPAKAPEEFALLAEALQKLIDELVRADQYDSADKAATSAVQHAKTSKDTELLARVMIRAKEVAEAKTLYQSMKSVMETQAKNPDDPTANLEIGRFLCFVKGGWDLGLRFIVKGSDAALKALAEKELAFPMQAGERVAVADGWYDLAEKEKSPLRKSQMLAHSRSLYESALPDAPPLIRAKIEKRLSSEPGRKGGRGGDLLAQIDPKRAPIGGGTWEFSGGKLVAVVPGDHSRLPTSFVPPEEYEVTLVVERKEGVGEFYIGLVGGGKQFTVHFDSGDSAMSGIWQIDGGAAAETGVPGKIFKNGVARTIQCTVRKDRVTVRTDGKSFINWKATWTRVNLHGALTIPEKNVVFFGARAGTFQVTKATVGTPTDK